MIVAWWTMVLAAAADETSKEDWWLGLQLSDVRLAAPKGGLPSESLEPLLRSRDGEALDLHAIRLDLATLYQVGEFAAVEAHVEHATTFDEAGEVIPGAQLTYRVYPAAKIAQLRVQGNRSFKDRELFDAAGLATGQVYFDDLDGPRSAARVTAHMNRRGYPDAEVAIRATAQTPARTHVLLDVTEGPPQTIGRVAFIGDLEGIATERQLRRWVRRAGIAAGRPLAPADVSAAQDVLREELGSMRRGPFTRSRGYIGARVTAAVLPDGDGTVVTYTIEPGPQLELDISGVGLWEHRRVREALQIDHRLRLTRGFMDRAPRQLEAWLQEQGWYVATAEISLERPSKTRQVLVVDVERGPFHSLGDVPKLFSSFITIDFTLTDGPAGTRAQRRERRALQTVIEQASPNVIRRDRYTDAVLKETLKAVKETYTDRGYLDAELTASPPHIETRRTLANGIRALFGAQRHRRLVPQVGVRRGPLTTLDALRVQGRITDLSTPWLEDAIAAQVSAPYSPQRLEALGRRLVGAHREAGYLDAEARVEHAAAGDNARRSVIVVDPGPQTLLRSIVTRGTRITRPGFVRREVDLALGQPLGQSSLDSVRSNLNELGIFRAVKLDLLGDQAARDLVISVTERPRWAFEAGGGVSTDQGIRAFGRGTRRNLLGLGHRLQLIAQVGLDYRSDDVRDWIPDITQPEWRVALSYIAPRFPLRSQEMTTDVVFRERRQERTWQMARSGAGAAVEWELDKHPRIDTRLRPAVRIESRRLNEVDPATLLDGEPWTTYLDDPERTWRVQEAVTALFVHDRRDDKVRPRSGALLTINGEWAPGLRWDLVRNQPRTSFLKGQARLASYVPLGPLVLHIAVGGGAIASLDGGLPPVEDRFRLGGTGSLRGFVRDGVGPQNIAGPVAVNWPGAIGPLIEQVARNDVNRWVPTGGDAVADATLELLVPLPALGLTRWDGYAAALFLDAGNTFLLDPSAEASSTGPTYSHLVPTLRVGAGLGARVATPVGPLQLDVAANPQAAFSNGDQRALLIDGWKEPVLRAHLTLGTVF